jgi:hypothetical protein
MKPKHFESKEVPKDDENAEKWHSNFRANDIFRSFHGQTRHNPNRNKPARPHMPGFGSGSIENAKVVQRKESDEAEPLELFTSRQGILRKLVSGQEAELKQLNFKLP